MTKFLKNLSQQIENTKKTMNTYKLKNSKILNSKAKAIS